MSSAINTIGESFNSNGDFKIGALLNPEIREGFKTDRAIRTQALEDMASEREERKQDRALKQKQLAAAEEMTTQERVSNIIDTGDTVAQRALYGQLIGEEVDKAFNDSKGFEDTPDSARKLIGPAFQKGAEQKTAARGLSPESISTREKAAGEIGKTSGMENAAKLASPTQAGAFATSAGSIMLNQGVQIAAENRDRARASEASSQAKILLSQMSAGGAIPESQKGLVQAALETLPADSPLLGGVLSEVLSGVTKTVPTTELTGSVDGTVQREAQKRVRDKTRTLNELQLLEAQMTPEFFTVMGAVNESVENATARFGAEGVSRFNDQLRKARETAELTLQEYVNSKLGTTFTEEAMQRIRNNWVNFEKDGYARGKAKLDVIMSMMQRDVKMDLDLATGKLTFDEAVERENERAKLLTDRLNKLNTTDRALTLEQKREKAKELLRQQGQQ
jgi:hypothetical protein